MQPACILVLCLMSLVHLEAQQTANGLNTIDPRLKMGGKRLSVADTENPATVRVVITEQLLCREREWNFVDGPTVTGALLAHRDTDQVPGAAARAPEVTRGNRVRLKIGTGIYTVAVEKLSPKDKAFIEQLKKALRQQTDSRNAQAAPAQPPITPPAHAP